MVAEMQAKMAEAGIPYEPTRELDHWSDEQITRALFEMGWLTEDDFKPV
jgi:hypothetical protein